jgi:hypothetical protein
MDEDRMSPVSPQMSRAASLEAMDIEVPSIVL